MAKLKCIALGIFMLVAGSMHFIHPGFYIKLIPPYLPQPNLLVVVSGAAEMLLGLLMFVGSVRKWAAWGIILLLIAVFPANIYMAQHPELFGFPAWTVWARLPLHGVFIYWAYRCSK